jgi:hypothetical protein
LAQQVGHYFNPVLQAIKRLGGSARPAEVCRAVARDLGLEGSPELEESANDCCVNLILSKLSSQVAPEMEESMASAYSRKLFVPSVERDGTTSIDQVN